MSADLPLSSEEHERYLRHLQLPGFGAAGQARLKAATVLIVGLGGLGCPAAQYLAAAGVGRLLLIDGDRVSRSNLQRQILFGEADIGHNKAVAARARLLANNPTITIEVIEQHLDPDNALNWITLADLVIDCTDNFHSRYLINDICHHTRTPWVYGSVLGFQGQLAVFHPGQACFRCIFPEVGEVPDCNQAGVLGVVPGLLGGLQALEAIKILSDMPCPDTDSRLWQFSALTLSLRPIRLRADSACPLCQGQADYRTLRADHQPRCHTPDPSQMIAARDFTTYCQTQQPLLIDVRTPQEHARGNLGGINRPLDSLISANDLNPDRCYLLYCQSGARSLRAVQTLSNNNDKTLNLKSLEGGMDQQQALLQE